MLIDQPSAQSLDHPGAAVGGGAPSDAEHDVRRAVIDGLCQHLTQAVGGGSERVWLPVGQQVEPAYTGQFDHRLVIVPGVGRRDWLTGRPRGLHRHRREAAGQGRRHRPIPTVGNGHPHHLGVQGYG